MSKESVAKKELVGWAYVRVSTAEQSNVLHGSIEQQLHRIKRWEAEQSARTGIPHRITRFIDEDIFRHFCACGDLQQTAKYCELKGYKTKERFTRAKVEKGKKIPPKAVGGMPFDRKNLRALLVNRKIAGFGYFKDDWNQFPHLQDENGMVRWELRHGPVVPIELFEKAQTILRKNAKFNHRIYADQRTYLLSGILFDQDGNKFSGQSVKHKKNPYYSNRTKNFRIRAERIENTVVSFLSSLLKKEGILEEAIKRAFNGENPIIKDLDEQISSNKKEINQCEQVLTMLASKGRSRILENPEKFDEILLEGVEIRRQTQSRMDDLQAESLELRKQKEELDKFKNKDDIKDRLRKALKLFESSSSKRKKRLIELLVPKLVLDEKRDQLFLFINPFLENSRLILQESMGEIELLLPKNLIQSDLKPMVQNLDSYCEILSQRGKKVCIAEQWRSIGITNRTFVSSLRNAGQA